MPSCNFAWCPRFMAQSVDTKPNLDARPSSRVALAEHLFHTSGFLWSSPAYMSVDPHVLVLDDASVKAPVLRCPRAFAPAQRSHLPRLVLLALVVVPASSSSVPVV